MIRDKDIVNYGENLKPKTNLALFDSDTCKVRLGIRSISKFYKVGIVKYGLKFYYCILLIFLAFQCIDYTIFGLIYL